MARINFEDDVEAQDEFWNLIGLLGGDRDRALGKLLRFFRLAQKAWGHDQPMTEAELRSKGMADMIESGWAIAADGGFHALGAAKHFAWYRQKVEAGKKGGRPIEMPEPDNRSVPPANPLPNRTVSAANPLALAPSLSLIQNTKTKTPKAKRREYPTEFDQIYKLYPRREKKSDGFKIYLREIQSDEDRDKLRQAIQNYCAHLRRQKTEPCFVMHFSTFMNEWDEWLDPDHGKVNIPGQKLQPRNLEAV